MISNCDCWFYWGLSTAVYANIVLTLIPVWWQMSRYGHPQLLAILFMLTGIALLGYRSQFASKHQPKAKIFVFDILIVAAFSLCLTIRIDAILMFPLIPACLLLEKYSLKTTVYHFIAYSFLALLLRTAVDIALPNPFPARHFAYLSPTLAIGIALLLSSIGKQATSYLHSNKLVTHTGIFFVFLFIFFSVSRFDSIRFYKNQYRSPKEAYNSGRLGQELQILPALNDPIFVIANEAPVIANMQLRSPSIKLDQENYFVFVYNGKNAFIFDRRAWYLLDGLVALKSKTEEFDEFYWLVDPFNPLVQKNRAVQI